MIARELTPLERRVAAAQALLDEWKGRPYDFAARSHCARMVADHLRRMGHRPPLARAGQYRSELGALRALKRMGSTSLADVLDGMALPRIVPAAAIAGDIVALPTASPLGCLTVAIGNGACLGFIDGQAGAVVLRPSEFTGAWGVQPL